MKTGYQKLDAARDGSSTASAVGFTTYPNAMPASQEAAPYLGRAQPAVTADQADVADRMVRNGAQMGATEIVRIWNETAFHIKDTLLEGRALAFDLGFVRLYPAISGTFPTADAAFNRDVNRLYLAVTPSDAIRDALKNGTPTRTDEVAGAKPRILKVTWGDWESVNVIKSGERFVIIGTALTLGHGGERAELKLPDGTVVPVTLEAQTPTDDGCQRVYGRLTQAVDACEGATLTLWTRGLSPESELIPVPSDKLTVLAGDVPPGPTPVGPEVTAINDGTFHAGAGNVITGANMRFADAFPGNHILIKDAQGTDMEAMISTDAEIPVTETRFALNLDEGQPLTDGEEYTFEFDMVDADNLPVTVTSKARWQAS